MGSGTCRRLMRMRVQVEDRPRIESTRMSSSARSAAACACPFFHFSNPSRAAFLSEEFATVISGCFSRRTDFAREGATRGASPSILRKCGGHGASPMPAASSLAANSNSVSSEPAASSIPAWGSPRSAKRGGMVRTVKSAGSQSGTSGQSRGAETRASGRGRTE